MVSKGERISLKKKLTIGLGVLFAIVAIGLMSHSASASAPDLNYDPAAAHASTVPVTLGYEYYGACDWAVAFAGSQGWSYDVYEVTLAAPTTFQIHVYDCCWVGDFYSVWIVDTTTGTTVKRFCFLGGAANTPEVQTDYHHSCVYFPTHTGLGTVLSDDWIGGISLPAGTYDFMVRDELFQELMSEPTQPLDGWSPAGFTIGFYAAGTHPVPEVPLGTVMAGAAMLFACIAFAGIKPLKMFRRRL
jgi:hypothetical protein